MVKLVIKIVIKLKRLIGKFGLFFVSINLILVYLWEVGK